MEAAPQRSVLYSVLGSRDLTCDSRKRLSGLPILLLLGLRLLGILLGLNHPCDVARLRQVFLNILDNAAKHGGQGQRITASISYEEGFVVIRIRDFGPGIPEDELPHVKMKFYKGSSTARGSGIGLAVCEEIVTMHGGSLTLENADGGGTLVTVRIPGGEAV